MIGWVLWDFNGTLADDLDATIAVVNEMLASRGLPPTDRAAYYADIEIPISRYYEKYFDMTASPLSVLTAEFQSGYARRFDREVRLGDGAEALLRAFEAQGVRQGILSSFRTARIRELLRRFGAEHYFETIMGADDDRCEEKITRAQSWMHACGVRPSDVLVIGDMTHDAEVAQALGAQCALVACGHQGRAALEATGAPVFDDLNALYLFLYHRQDRE